MSFFYFCAMRQQFKMKLHPLIIKENLCWCVKKQFAYSLLVLKFSLSFNHKEYNHHVFGYNICVN